MPEEKRGVNDSDIDAWRTGTGGSAEGATTGRRPPTEAHILPPPGPVRREPAPSEAAPPAQSTREETDTPLGGLRLFDDTEEPAETPAPSGPAPTRPEAEDLTRAGPRPPAARIGDSRLTVAGPVPHGVRGEGRQAPANISVDAMLMIEETIMYFLPQRTLEMIGRSDREVDVFEVLGDAARNAKSKIEGEIECLDTTKYMQGDHRIYGVSADGAIQSPGGSTKNNYKPNVRKMCSYLNLVESAIPMWVAMGHGNTEGEKELRRCIGPARKTCDIYDGLVDCNDALEDFDFDGYNVKRSHVLDLIRRARTEGTPAEEVRKYEREIKDTEKAGLSGLEAKYVVSDLIWKLYNDGVIAIEGRTDEEKKAKLRILRNHVLRNKQDCLESGDESVVAFAICTSVESVSGAKLHFRRMGGGNIKRILGDERVSRMLRDFSEREHSQKMLESQLTFTLEGMKTGSPGSGGGTGVEEQLIGIREQLAALVSNSRATREEVSSEHETPNRLRRYLPYAGTAAGAGLATLFTGWLFGGSPDMPAPAPEPPAAIAPASPQNAGSGGQPATEYPTRPDAAKSPFDRRLRVYDAEVVPLSPGDSRKRLMIKFGPENPAGNEDRFVGYMELLPGEEGIAGTLAQNLERHGIYVTNTPSTGGLRPELGRLTDSGREVYMTRSHFRLGNE